MNDELAGLPEDVREALRRADAGFDHTGLFDEPAWQTIRAELLRLARENAILEIKNRGTLANNLCPDHRDKQTGKPCLACTIETLTRQKERAEAELAALKRSPQGTVQAVRPQADGCYVVEVRCDPAGVASLFSQRVALLPVGVRVPVFARPLDKMTIA